MNLTPIIRSLDNDDFAKIIGSCRGKRDAFPYVAARYDPLFEFHIDLPHEDTAPEPMEKWVHDETRFE